MKQLTIGITDCGKFSNYEKWVSTEPWVRVCRLGYKQNNFLDIKNCDAILLTGGQDVHPRFYNKPEYLEFCLEADERRDEFELSVLEYSQQHQLPVLGICRGLQITNVFSGGTLIPDIVTAGNADHSKFDETHDRYHSVNVKQDSLLSSVIGRQSGEINSAHHQCVDRVGHGLSGNAVSEDGVVEGLERSLPDGKSFLLLVQWHPERMEDQQSTFATNIKRRFLEAVRESRS
jgi:putative glutamine amidotransferase